MEQSEKGTSGKGLLRTIIIVVVVVLAGALMKQFLKSPSFEKALIEAANDVSKSCPMMLDDDTRLDSATVILPKTFQYNYTLINFEKEELDVLELKNMLEPDIVNFIRTSRDMKNFRDNKVVINYYYNDKNGDYLLNISVSPEQYE